MSDADAFLEAIRANPEDDLPRLVYADWLEEHGEELYARFIRLGDVIKKRAPLPPAERKALRHERYLLSKQLEQTWGELAPGIFAHKIVDYRTGEPSPSPVLFETAPFLEWDGPWPFFLPRQRLTFADYFGLEERLISSPRLEGVVQLHFMGHPGPMSREPPHAPVSDSLIRVLVRAGSLATVRELAIGDLCPTSKMLGVLAQSQIASRLTNFYFDWPIEPVYHRWIDVKASQPPDGAISAAIVKFLGEYGEMLPVE